MSENDSEGLNCNSMAIQMWWHLDEHLVWFLCPNVYSGLRYYSSFHFLCANPLCHLLHAFPRCLPQGSQHLWLPCLHHHSLLVPGIFTTLTQGFGHHTVHHGHVLLGNVCILTPLMLKPIIYGVKMKQIWDQVVHVLLSRQKWLMLKQNFSFFLIQGEFQCEHQEANELRCWYF